MNLLKESFQTYIEGSLFQNTLHPLLSPFFHTTYLCIDLNHSGNFKPLLHLSYHSPCPTLCTTPVHRTSTFSHLTNVEIDKSLKQETGNYIEIILRSLYCVSCRYFIPDLLHAELTCSDEHVLSKRLKKLIRHPVLIRTYL